MHYKLINKKNNYMQNLTGRVFICVSYEKDDNGLWNEFFTIGKLYFEAKYDSDGVNLCEADELGNEDSLLLSSDAIKALYVDRDCFALMLETTESMQERMKYGQ